MRAILSCICFFLALNFLFAQYTVQESVYFETDQYELTSASIKSLNQLSNDLESLPGLKVKILAHTDDRGTVDYNFKLAEQRAKSVQDFLAKRGLLVEQTEVASFGELQPSFDNEKEDGRQGNRRVDIILNYRGVTSVDEVFGLIDENQTQFFEIDPSKATRIIGKNGTSIWIEANSFVLADGSLPGENIKIQLKETYNEADMILSGLMTTSGDQLLETGGMVSIEAIANGEKLNLQQGQELIVGMPTEMQQEGMELFMGVTNSNGTLTDWQPTNQSYEKDVITYLKFPPRPKAPRDIYPRPKFKLDLSDKPVEPKQPRAPYKPYKPNRKSIKYKPGFVKRLFLSKKKIKEKEEAIFEKKMKEYEQRLEKYQERMVSYEQEQVKYHLQMSEYKRELRTWEKSLKQQYANHRESEAYQKKMDSYKKAYEKKMELYKKRLAAWKVEKERILEEFENKYDIVGNMDAQTLNRYLFRVNELGWINCDRFYNIPDSEKMELAFTDADPEEERVFIVFKEIESILRPVKRGNQYISRKIPKSAPVKIIGVKVKNGRPQLAIKETQVDALAADYTLDFQNCSLKELRNTLTRLN